MNFELKSRITYPDLLNNLSQSFKTLKHDDLRSFILLFVTISKKPAPLLSYTCALPASSALFAPHAWPFVLGAVTRYHTTGPERRTKH